MPYAVASMPHVFVAGTQQVRAVENAIIMHSGASGGGGVHTPLTMLPHCIDAVSQHATGGVFDNPAFATAATHIIPPHITGAADPVPAVAPVPAAAPVPATVDVPQLPAAVAVVPAVTAVVPLAAAAPVPAAAGVVGASPPQAPI
jgi:hypothetical protein